MSKKRKLKRCKLIVDGVRCNLDATHGLYDETGKRVKGTAYCEEHARQYIAAHSRWSNLTWTAEPFDPRAGSSYQSSPELEAQITGAREYAADIIGHGFGADDDMTVELAVELVEKDKRIAELEDALRFYADCEWGWNGGGNYEPMIMELPEVRPDTLDCKFAGSVARAALKEATDDHTT